MLFRSVALVGGFGRGVQRFPDFFAVELDTSAQALVTYEYPKGLEPLVLVGGVRDGPEQLYHTLRVVSVRGTLHRVGEHSATM